MSLVAFSGMRSAWPTMLLVAISVPAGVHAARPPEFVALVQTAESGGLFCVRWQREDGARVTSWTTIGGHVDGYVVRSFDPTESALTLTDTVGRSIVLRLPEGHVSAQDEEFRRLERFVGYKGADAPVLSRDQARALWLWLIKLVGAPDPGGYELDLDGHTVPPAQRAKYLEEVAQRAKAGTVVIRMWHNGESYGISVPRNSFNLPEPMLRNLTADDWDELSLLTAIARANKAIRRRAGQP